MRARCALSGGVLRELNRIGAFLAVAVIEISVAHGGVRGFDTNSLQPSKDSGYSSHLLRASDSVET